VISGPDTGNIRRAVLDDRGYRRPRRRHGEIDRFSIPQ
jgi:hypothetical protein